MSNSNCCFLTCIQISQEADQVVWYSHLFQNFPQFIVFHTVKGFGIVNEVEIDVFLELSCFFHDPAHVGNLISGSSAFSKTSLNIRKLTVHLLLKPGLENFERYFTFSSFSSYTFQGLLCVYSSLYLIVSHPPWEITFFSIQILESSPPVSSHCEALASACLLMVCHIHFAFQTR